MTFLRWLRSPSRRAVRPALLAAFALASLGVFAESAHVPPFPVTPNAAMQAGLERIIREHRLDDAVSAGQLALMVVDLEGDEVTGFAGVNTHRMMYAASLPKIAILFGAALALDQGRIEATAAVENDMSAMIRYSCNACATRMLDRIGRNWLLQQLQAEPYRLYNAETHGGLWVGKDYAPVGAYRRDPLAGLSHGATAWQVARFYWLLSAGALVSEAQTRRMLDALAQPGVAHKFVAGLSHIEDIQLFRKSGTWRDHHSDSALVIDGDHPCCILVALAQHGDGEQWLRTLAPELLALARGRAP